MAVDRRGSGAWEELTSVAAGTLAQSLWVLPT